MTTPEHEQLQDMWNRGVFRSHIQHIRFPKYRNLAPGLEIRFQHPITALVGPNGTNKTSILRALQGCPKGSNLGLYWFGTAIDPIPDPGQGQRPERFIYGRWSDSEKEVVEVIKTRVRRKIRSGPKEGQYDPDYFEPSKALTEQPDSMKEFPGGEARSDSSTDRWNPIDKSVVYLDFRSELSAYDKYFFHAAAVPKTGREKLLDHRRFRKERIRLRAKRLRHALDHLSATDPIYGDEKIVSPCRLLSISELAQVGEILGRKYTEIRLLEHKYYDRVVGSTVLMASGRHRYSEAFAGSGEFAVVMLVTKISAAPKDSLVLLDEPEVSLHPGAQDRLMRFLTSVSKAKHVQFVLSTHSPTLIRDLPAGAIKVLQVDVQSGKVLLASQSSPAIVAFASIGHAHSDVPTIYVEDALAKELVLAAIRGDNGKYLGKVKVDFLEGGCDALWGTYIPIWAREDRTNTYVFFDGDQTRRSPKEDTQIPSGQLDFEIEETFGSPPTILVDGSGGQGREDQKEHRKRRLLAWRARHVQFLPGDTPEALVLAMVGGGPSVAPKQQWDERTKADLGLIDGEATDSREILSTQRRALATVDKDNAEFDNIRQLVLGAVEGAPSHLAPGGKNASR